MASNESDTDSVISIQLDVSSDGEVDNQSDEKEIEESDSSSTNDITGLIEEIDSFSDIADENTEQNSKNGDPTSGAESDTDLCVDVDNLANDTRSPDEMHDILNKDPEWTQDFMDIHVKQFTGPVRTNLSPEFDTSIATPLDYFQLFFPDEVFQTICDNTNKFKQFRVQQKRITTPDFVEKFWEDTNVPEMKAYFGLAVIFGLLNQPRYRNFWSKDPFLGNQGVQRVFSLKRYSKLSEYLHVSNREAEKNKGHPSYDKLGKIRWLYNHLLEAFSKYKHPEKIQVLDEQLMPFSGRVSYIQYHVSVTLTLTLSVTLTWFVTLTFVVTLTINFTFTLCGQLT